MREAEQIRRRVGARIKQIRKAKGLTLEDVTSDTGNLSRLERGVQGASLDTLAKYAKALGCDVAELFREEGVVMPTTSTQAYELVAQWQGLPMGLRQEVLNRTRLFAHYAERLSPFVRENIVPPDMSSPDYPQWQRDLDEDVRRVLGRDGLESVARLSAKDKATHKSK